MNRWIARSQTWITLALVLPVVVSIAGVLLFQVICTVWCGPASFAGVPGFAESTIAVSCACTAIMGLVYLVFWQRSIINARQPRHDAWLLVSGLIILLTFIPIMIILAPLFPGWGNLLSSTGLLALVGWSVAVVIGMLLRISLARAWALNPAEYLLWARQFAGSWNWGWLIICIGGALVPIAGFVTFSMVVMVVGWIICWCIGWWKIGIPIGRSLQDEVLRS
jgi:hypothetical protein